MKFYIFQNLVFAEFDDVKRKAAEREKRVIGMVIPIKTSTPRSERRSASYLFEKSVMFFSALEYMYNLIYNVQRRKNYLINST